VTAWSCRSNRPSRALRADPSRSARSSDPFIAHATRIVVDRAPLLRFFPLQHTLAASRCPKQPCLGRSRFGVTPIQPARTRTFRWRSPLRFFALWECDVEVLVGVGRMGLSVPVGSVAFLGG
jgi:hypothetical protein